MTAASTASTSRGSTQRAGLWEGDLCGPMPEGVGYARYALDL
jgi:hypothetical protein